MTTLREELENIFDRFSEFTNLGERYGFKEDIARVGKLQFAKQISDSFKPKTDEAKKQREAKDWLKDLVAAGVKPVTARRKDKDISKTEKVDLVPNWNEYVKFKEAYALLIRRLLMDLSKLAKDQKWLDAKGLAQSVNEIDLRGLWRHKESYTAGLKRVLSKLVKDEK